MKRTISIILTILMISTSLLGCSSGDEKKETIKENKTITNSGKTDLVLAKEADATTLDPQAGWDGNSLVVMRQLFNGLVKLDENLKPVPDLAESYEYLSDTQIQFKLRKGVKFHNGEEMKASDVKYSIERAMSSAKVKSFTANIKEVKIVDDYTVEIETDIAYAPLLYNLCHTACYIVPQNEAEKLGEGFTTAPIGTGPFQFSEWISGDRIVLKKNPNYFSSQVMPSTLTFRIIPEGTSRTIALETGEVDMVLDITPVDAGRVEESKDLRLVETLSPKIEYISMNQKVGPFSNKKVRQAVNYAIDRNAIFEVIAGNRGKVTNSVMSCKVSGYKEDVPMYDYNPEKAKALLAEAGYPNGFDTVISISGDARNRTAEIMQAFLLDVGINASIENLEWGTFLEKVNRGEYEIFDMSYNNTTGDPDTSLYMLFNSGVPASSGNRSFTNIPEVDKLLEKGRLEIDQDKRLEIYGQIQDILAEEAVWVPLFSIAGLFGLRADLQGFIPHPLGNDVFDQLHY